MPVDIPKLCADFLRTEYATATGGKLKASHAHEVVAAFFGYKSRAALLAEKTYLLSQLNDAEILAPDIQLIEARRTSLEGLPADLPESKELASSISDLLMKAGQFSGEVWLYGSLEEYLREVWLPDQEAVVSDGLSGVMTETNAIFDQGTWYEQAEITDNGDVLTVEVTGQADGTSDSERPFCGDQIDVKLTVDFVRVAGKVAFYKPDITSIHGEINDDWVDPELKYGTSGPSSAAP